MKDKKAKSSPGLIAAVIAAGAADVILLVLLVLFLVLPEAGGGSVEADVPEDFTANSDTYYDTEYESEYTSDASVSFSEGSVQEGGASDTDSGDPEDGGQYSGFVFPDSDTTLLTDEQISETVTDAATCRRAVNEIYARHHRKFVLEDVQAYFDSKSWYQGTVEAEEFDVRVMNQYESANINLMVADMEKIS